MSPKAKNIVAWILQVLVALQFLMAGGTKFIDTATWIERFANWGYPAWFNYVIGLVEVAGAVLLVLPKYARYGAILLILNMVGAAVTHIRADEPLWTNLVVIALLSAVWFLRKPQEATPAE